MTRFLTRPGCRGALIVGCCVAWAGSGCGRAAAPQDPAPFQSAVERYLEQNNMALRIKEIERGPDIAGNRATMTVSLTHAELGGPSVVWEFDFTQQAGGNWEAVKRAP